MRRTRWQLAISFVLAGLACATHSHASTFVMMSEGELATRSVAAVTGQVTQIEAAMDSATGGVQTYVHIDPDDGRLRALPAGEIVLRETGGSARARRVDLRQRRVPGRRGGAGVPVAERRRHPAHDGAWRWASSRSKPADERRVYAASAPRRGRRGVGPDARRARRGPASGRVRLRHAARRGAHRDDAGRAALAQAAVRCSMVPPELVAHSAALSSTGGVHLLSPPSRWFEPDNGLPIPYLIDATGDVGVGAVTSRAAINDAFARVDELPTSDLTLTDGGKLAQVIASPAARAAIASSSTIRSTRSADPVGCGGVLAIGGFCSSSGDAHGERHQLPPHPRRQGHVQQRLVELPGLEPLQPLRGGHARDRPHARLRPLDRRQRHDVREPRTSTAAARRCASDDLDALQRSSTRACRRDADARPPTPARPPLPPTPTHHQHRRRRPRPDRARRRRATPTRTVRAVDRNRTDARRSRRRARPRRGRDAPARDGDASPSPRPGPDRAHRHGDATPTSTPRPRHRVRGHVQYYAADQAVPDVTVILSGDDAPMRRRPR